MQLAYCIPWDTIKGMPDMINIINEYTDENGESPYAAWLCGLRDARAIAKIIVQVDKMELGLFGDVEPVGGRFE